MVKANKTRKVDLVIISSKGLLTHVLVLLPFEAILMFMLKDAVKKKIWENLKKQSYIQVSHTFKTSFMLKNMWKN